MTLISFAYDLGIVNAVQVSVRPKEEQRVSSRRPFLTAEAVANDGGFGLDLSPRAVMAGRAGTA